MLASAKSRLFQNAVAGLEAGQQRTLISILELLGQTLVDGSENDRGDRVRGHIESEHQLSSDPAIANPALMKRFLRILLACVWHPLSPQDRVKKYRKIAKAYARRGPILSNTPAQLYRYTPATSFFYYIEKHLREKAGRAAQADTMLRLRQSAGAGGDWTKPLRFVQESAVWDRIKGLPLTASPSLFITFDEPSGSRLSRMSTREMWHALALYHPPVATPNALVEILIDAGHLPECPRYPTLADAGWYSFFLSAEAGEPHGWTKPHPHTPSFPKQPEAVLPPLTLSHVASPHRVRVLSP